MRFYKDKEVVFVEVIYGSTGTRQWNEKRRWWRKPVLYEEKFTKPTYVVVGFHDKDCCERIFCDTHKEAEALALKIKEKYGLINLKEL